MKRLPLYLLLVTLFLLHNDWWFWNNSDLVLGLPIGLTYHVGLCLAAVLVMFLLVRFAWPRHLDEVEEETT